MAAVGAAGAGLVGQLEAVRGSVPPQSRKAYEAMLGWLSGDRTTLANVQTGSFAFNLEERDEALLGVIRRQTSLLEQVDGQRSSEIKNLSKEDFERFELMMRFLRVCKHPEPVRFFPKGTLDEVRRSVEDAEQRSGVRIKVEAYPQVELDEEIDAARLEVDLHMLYFTPFFPPIVRFGRDAPRYNHAALIVLFSYLQTGEGVSRAAIWKDKDTKWVIEVNRDNRQQGLAILSDALSRFFKRELELGWSDLLEGKLLLSGKGSARYALLFQDSQCWGDLPVGGPKCFSSYLMEGLNNLRDLTGTEQLIAEEIRKNDGDISKMITPQNNLLVFGVVNQAVSQVFVNRMRMNPELKDPVNRNPIWIMSEIHFEQWHPIKVLHMNSPAEESSAGPTSNMWGMFSKLTGITWNGSSGKRPEISPEFVEFVQAAKEKWLGVFTIIHQGARQHAVGDSDLTQAEWELQKTEDNFFSMVQSLRGGLFKEPKETFNELMTCLWGEFSPENESRSCDLPLIVLQAGDYKEVFERLCSFVHEHHFGGRGEIASLDEQRAFTHLVYAYQRYEMIFRLSRASDYDIGFMGAHSKHGASSASSYVFDGLLDFVHKLSGGPDPASPQVLAERLEEVMRLQAIRPGAVRHEEQLSAMQAGMLLLKQAGTMGDTLEAFATQFSTRYSMTRASSCNPREMACLKVRTSGVIGQIFAQKAMREMHYKPPYEGVIEAALEVEQKMEIDLSEVDYVGESELLTKPTMAKLLPLLQVGIVQAKSDLYRRNFTEVCRDAERKVVVTYSPESQSLSCVIPVVYQDDDDEAIAHLECETILTNITFDEDGVPHADVTVGWRALD